MKKILGLGAILGVTLGVCLLANNLTAQNTAAARPTNASTKIGLLNLSYVMKNYQKTIALQGEFKEMMQPLISRQKAKQAQYEALVKEAQTKPEQRETIEKQLRNLKREIEDANNEAQVQIGKRESELVVALYKEIQDATSRVAQSQGFDIVLHYNDGLTSADYWSPQNIGRKISEGACLPIYYGNGVEVSTFVVDVLNTAYAKNHPAPAAGTAPAGTPVTPTNGVAAPSGGQ
ncbi:MAG: OmpH family outer membrane protein [Planctomycetota bacterium]